MTESHMGVPKHNYVPADWPHEDWHHDNCWFEWRWPLRDGSTSLTRCRSPLNLHISLGWDVPDRAVELEREAQERAQSR